jgi:hypothetical protein
MINAEDEVYVDLSTSCTKDEAVAKMLGWMQGQKRLKYIQVSAHGISADQLPYLHTLEAPLNEYLMALRESARHELLDAVEAGAANEVIYEKDDAVAKCDALINKAMSYFLDINEELDKDESSELKIDRPKSESSDEIHITLKSLDRWARKNYGIHILESTVNSGSNPSNANPDSLTSIASSLQKTRRYDALAAELDVILKGMQKPTATKVMAVLRAKIGSSDTCIITNVGDGIQWENGVGDVKMLTIDALSERIRVWKKRTENQG